MVKDLAVPLLWLRFNPWPGELPHAAGAAKKKKKKKKGLLNLAVRRHW